MSKKEDRLWAEGFERACDIAEREGIEKLLAERKFRGATGFHYRMTSSELDAASEDIKKLIFGTLRIAFVSVLHDEFGFGKTRITKFLDGLDKFATYLDYGWLYWMDAIKAIDDDLGINLMIENGEDHFRLWQRPEPKDVYSEVDLVEKDSWTARLNYLGLVDDGKGRVESKDHGWCWKYENQYDKIQIYDELGGIVLAVNALGARKPGEENENSKPA